VRLGDVRDELVHRLGGCGRQRLAAAQPDGIGQAVDHATDARIRIGVRHEQGNPLADHRLDQGALR
jgi:hypothetical protein